MGVGVCVGVGVKVETGDAVLSTVLTGSSVGRSDGSGVSVNGVIVSTADKYAAVKDIVQGSEIKHTGMKQYVSNLVSGNRKK